MPELSRRSLFAGAAALAVALPWTRAFAATRRPRALVEPDSTLFATADVPYAATVGTASDGDLWANCWADDGNLYAANGDGRGFSANQNDFADVVVNRISGDPASGLSGVRLTGGAAVGPIWTAGNYNRKPTGMVAVDGNGDGRDELYLAVQDLCTGPGNAAFNDVPAASIAVSTDYGATWTPTAAPMFAGHVFTTVFFLDYGQSNGNCPDQGYVYAYGLDGNWRASYTGAVPDPQDLYLARVPVDSITDRSAWQFFTGLSGATPQWSADIGAKASVLHDERREYPGAITAAGCSVISQGSVVYNAGLKRYLYTSWTEYTFEFYEAPQPWGPWKLFLHKDCGPYPWWGDGAATPKYGGYATTVPSKFHSADGTHMWVQSNWFAGIAAGATDYHFSLRPLTVAPYEASTPTNAPSVSRDLAMEPGTVAIDKTSHYGHLGYLNDTQTTSEDSWDGSAKDTDRWGYTWPVEYTMDTVIYTTGQMFTDGGWFASGLTVQVRRNFVWTTVTNLSVNPPYPYNSAAGPGRYVFSFDNTAGDGVRILGAPGGTAHFTSIGELEAYLLS